MQVQDGVLSSQRKPMTKRSTIRAGDAFRVMELLDLGHCFYPESREIAALIVSQAGLVPNLRTRSGLTWPRFVSRYGATTAAEIASCLWEFRELSDRVKSDQLGVDTIMAELWERDDREYNQVWCRKMLQWLQNQASQESFPECGAVLKVHFTPLLKRIIDPAQRVAFISLMFPLIEDEMDQDTWRSCAGYIKKAFVDAGRLAELPKWREPYPEKLPEPLFEWGWWQFEHMDEYAAIVRQKREAGPTQLQRATDRVFEKHNLQKKKQRETERARRKRRNLRMRSASLGILPTDWPMTTLGVMSRRIVLDELRVTRNDNGRYRYGRADYCPDLYFDKDRLYFCLTYDDPKIREKLRSVFGYVDCLDGSLHTLSEHRTDGLVEALQIISGSLWYSAPGAGIFSHSPARHFDDRSGIPGLHLPAMAHSGRNLFVGGGGAEADFGCYDIERQTWAVLHVPEYRDMHGDLRPMGAIKQLEAVAPYVLARHDANGNGGFGGLSLYDTEARSWEPLKTPLLSSLAEARVQEESLTWLQAHTRHSRLTAMLADDGVFWIGGDAVLFRYDPIRKQATSWGTDPRFIRVPGEPFIAERRAMLAGRYTGKHMAYLYAKCSRLSGHISALCADQDFLYVATFEDIYDGMALTPKVLILDKSSNRWVGQFHMPTKGAINKMVSSSNRLWIAVSRRSATDHENERQILHEVDTSQLRAHDEDLWQPDVLSDDELREVMQGRRPREQVTYRFLISDYAGAIEVAANIEDEKIDPGLRMMLIYANDELGLNDREEYDRQLQALKSQSPGIFKTYMEQLGAIEGAATPLAGGTF